MRFVGDNLKRLLVVTGLTFLGRRNFYRLSRALMEGARLDVINDPRLNGEDLVQDVVLRHACKGETAVVFDVGANIGEWTTMLLAKARVQNIPLTVHAFEPCEATYRTLVERTKLLEDADSVTTVQKACSNSTGASELHVVSDGSLDNTLVPYASEGVIRVERVDTVTIDDYCAVAGLGRIALVKVDAEGHDLEVLKGASGMLAGHAIGALQFEYNQKWVFARHFLRDCFELFSPLGYRLGKVTPRGIEFYTRWVPEQETFRQGNYLACSPAWGMRFKEVRPPWERP